MWSGRDRDRDRHGHGIPSADDGIYRMEFEVRSMGCANAMVMVARVTSDVRGVTACLIRPANQLSGHLAAGVGGVHPTGKLVPAVHFAF